MASNIENFRLKPGGLITHQITTESNGDVRVREHGGKIVGYYDASNKVARDGTGNYKGNSLVNLLSLIR